MTPPRFLVTGATGFLGSRVVTQLLKKGLPVVATDIHMEAEGKQLRRRVAAQGLDTGLLILEPMTLSISGCFNRQ